MGCEPHRLSSMGPRRGATSRARGCKFVSSGLLATTALVAVTAFAPGAAQGAGRDLAPNSGIGRILTPPPTGTRPTVPTGTAFFGTSNTTALTFSANTTVGGWTFNAGAPAYTFTNNQSLNFNGAGIVINGGSATITNNIGGTPRFQHQQHGRQRHHQQQLQSWISSNISTAGNAAITNNNGDLRFSDTSARPATPPSPTTTLSFFFDNSTAGNAAITNSSGAAVDFSAQHRPCGRQQAHRRLDCGRRLIPVGSQRTDGRRQQPVHRRQRRYLGYWWLSG